MKWVGRSWNAVVSIRNCYCHSYTDWNCYLSLVLRRRIMWSEGMTEQKHKIKNSFYDATEKVCINSHKNKIKHKMFWNKHWFFITSWDIHYLRRHSIMDLQFVAKNIACRSVCNKKKITVVRGWTFWANIEQFYISGLYDLTDHLMIFCVLNFLCSQV